MADRRQLLDLESTLVDLGRHLDYPPTPDLASRLHITLAARPRPPSRWQRLLASPPRLALASVVVVLVILLALTAAWPQARSVVAERLGLRGAPIEQISRVPNPTTVASFDLGERTTLADARRKVTLLVPATAELGDPDDVYFAPSVLGGTVTLVYSARPGLPPAPDTGVGLLVLESRLPPSGFQPAIVGKGVGPGTHLEELSVNGGRGVWLEGAPHEVFLPDASGQFRQERVRLAGNVLLWEQAGLLIRLEGALSKDQALQVAASVR